MNFLLGIFTCLAKSLRSFRNFICCFERASNPAAMGSGGNACTIAAFVAAMAGFAAFAASSIAVANQRGTCGRGAAIATARRFPVKELFPLCWEANGCADIFPDVARVLPIHGQCAPGATVSNPELSGTSCSRGSWCSVVDVTRRCNTSGNKWMIGTNLRFGSTAWMCSSSGTAFVNVNSTF